MGFITNFIDKMVKDRISDRVKNNEDEIENEIIEKSYIEAHEKIDNLLAENYKNFFIKIFINLIPIVIGLSFFLLNPNDFTRKILILGYAISILIGLYEFIKFTIKFIKFFNPIFKHIFSCFKFKIPCSIFSLKSYIKYYLQDKLLYDSLYEKIYEEGKERIKEELNKHEGYKKLQNIGYEYKDVDDDANNLAQHVVYETSVPNIIWDEIVRYIKYSLLTKWLFASILIISYIFIFRLFILPFMITHFL